jgi:hypothetical protein
MQTLTDAKPCRAVQKEEWITTIQQETILNPKITNNDLAEKYGVHRNRISKYRNILRKRQLRESLEIVNKIDSILEDHLADMEDRDLITYRKQLIPQQIEMKADIREIKLEWKLESNPTNPVYTPPETTGVS